MARQSLLVSVLLCSARIFLRQTCKEAMSSVALLYTGAGDNPELLEWHAELLLNAVAALVEVDEYGRHFPWRCVGMLSEQLQAHTLEAMRDEWNFVTSFVDSLKPRTTLHRQLAVTRHQAYRDLMVKAEPTELNSEDEISSIRK